GYEALALTDRDNLYLAIRFDRCARAEGLTPLLGAELTFAPDRPPAAATALLLPLDRRGFANLCRLLTLRHLEPRFDATGALVERLAPDACAARESWLAAPAVRVWRIRATCAGAGVPEAADMALANNAALAERCRLTLELGTPIFPHAPVPPGESGPGYLL